MSGCNCRPRRVYLPPKAQMTKALLAWIVQSCGRELELLPLTEMEGGAAGDMAVFTSEDFLAEPLPGPGMEGIADIRLRPELASCGAHLVTFSDSSDSADFTARNIRVAGSAAAFEIVGIGLIGRVRLNGMADRGAVLPAIAAAAAALTAGVPFAIMMDALNSFPASAYLG